jgi:hypothetical protein
MTKKPDISALLPDDVTLAARRRALEAELQTPRYRPPGAPRRRLAVAVLALVALGGGAAWATGVFSAKDISFQAGVGCYSEARLHGPRLSVTVTRAAADPVAKCERYWREGVVDTVQRRLAQEGKIEYPRGPYPPHLVACANPGSGIAVFPGPEAVCKRLGFEPLPGDYNAPGREAARAYTAWNRILARRFQVIKPGRCLSPEPIAERVQGLLAAHGYPDVAVRISTEGPCAKSVESRGRTIEVLTTSPHEDDAARLAEQAFDALSDLFERASLECIPPERFGALARDVLARVGLSQIRVGVSQRFFPCTYGSGGFSPEELRVDIGAQDHKTWRGNRAGFLRYQRHLRRWKQKQAGAHASANE